MKLEEVRPQAVLRGVVPGGVVTVVGVQWYGSEAMEMTYKTAAGAVANELLYRHDEGRIEVVEAGRPWSFDGDRFEGRFRDGVHTVDVSDLMRRMVKERLLKFDATPLFSVSPASTTTSRNCWRGPKIRHKNGDGDEDKIVEPHIRKKLIEVALPLDAINDKAMIEIPPKFAGRPPVNPDARWPEIARLARTRPAEQTELL